MIKNGVYHIGGNTIVVNHHTSEKANKSIIKKYPQLDDNSRKKSDKDSKSSTKSKQGKSSGFDND